MFEVSSANKTTSKSSSARTEVQRKAEPSNPLASMISNSDISSRIQTKLKTGSPGDKYEREADKAADEVSSNPTEVVQPSIQLKTGGDLGQKQAEDEEEEPIQMQAEEEEEELQAKSESEQEREDSLQKQEEEEVQAQEEEEELQAKSAKAGKPDTEFEKKLYAAKGQGSPLPDDSKKFMEPRLKADFSNVRIHSDERSVEMNKQMRSQAFTVGSDVFFNSNKFNPDTNEGKKLLAHELTHVVQQGKADRKQAQKETSESEKKKSTEIYSEKSQSPESLQKETSQAQDTETPASRVSQEQSGNEKAAEPQKASQEEKPAEQKPQEIKQKEAQAPGESALTAGEGRSLPAGGGGGGEKPAKVESLPMDGKSEEVMKSFADAKPSQIAASYPSLGSAVSNKLQQEQQETADSVPPIKAKAGGVKELPGQEAQEPKAETADIDEGIKGAEPAKQKIEDQKHAGEPPSNKIVDKQLDNVDEGGFFSWFRDKFKSFIGGVSTTDHGLNTSAGKRPEMDLSGKADPARVESQKADGKSKAESKKSETVKTIKSNPGKENIQPVKVDEQKKPEIKKKADVAVETKEDKGMKEYAQLPYPPDMREAADNKLKPLTEKSLAKQKEDVAAAAKKRDTDKSAEIKRAEQENAKLNQNAEKEQGVIVGKYRKDVDDKQKEGMKEAEDKLAEFDKEAEDEKKSQNEKISGRIKEDKDKADKKLTDAEKDAEKEKEKGEKKAREKKRELENESESDSWWDRAVNAVKSAVKAVTDAIDKVFDAVRKAVNTIIEKAKEAALAVIEAGRRWVVEQLDKFGKWLKEKVNKYIGSVFPGIAKKINAAIDTAVNKAKDAVNFVADKLKKGVEALANAVANAINSILDKFQAALKAAVQIAGALLTGDFAEALKIAFFAACEVAGIDPKPIMDFINRAGETIKIIFKNPLRFFMNVVNGVKKGLNQFLGNIKKHLLNGLIGWLTGAISEAGITLPDKFDLKGIFSLVMQILGLTYQNIRAKVVKKLGPKGEEIVSKLETAVGFIKDLVTRGPIVLWEKVKEKLTNLKETVIGGIRDWVISTVIKEGIMWIISLLNPASAIAKALKMLYDFVMFLVERYQQIVSFVKSVFDSVGALARGTLGKAANAVEGALGKSVPVIISFMASLLGLGGISKTIKKIIGKVRKPVDKALDKVISWIVKKGKALLKKGKAFFGKDKEVDRGGSSTREKNKKAAAGEVQLVMQKGISKPDLKALLKNLMKKYKLKSAKLNKNDDVVITNSQPEIIKGKPYGQQPNAKPENLALKKEGKSLKKDQAGPIKLGTYKSSGAVYPTLHGAVGNYLNFTPVQFPVKEIPRNAARPDNVNATLEGAVEDGLSSSVTRDSGTTAAVGYIGDIESAMRRNVVSAQNAYHGGHIIASRFGGPENYKNLVPQQGNKLNLGLYKQMENFIAKNVKNVNKSGAGIAPANKNSKVDVNIKLSYGSEVTRTLEDTMKVLGSRIYLKQFRDIHKMPENTKKQRQQKKQKLAELGNEKRALYEKLSPKSLDKPITIAGRIPTGMAADVKFATETPVGIEGKKEEFAEKSDKDVKGEIIIAENAKVNESGMPEPKESGAKTEKKNWAATFNFSQSNTAK